MTIGTITSTGVIPQFMDFVGSDYGTSDCPQVTARLKLIRSTTSKMGYAVATSDYPTTNPSLNNIQTIGYVLYNGSSCYVDGKNGVLYDITINGKKINAIGSYGYVSTGLSIIATFSINGNSTTATFIDEW